MSNAKLAIAAALFWPACCACALAQAPGSTMALRGPLTLVQFQVVSGRLLVTPRQPGRSSTWTNSSRDRTERMQVNLTGGEPRIEYELSTKGMRLAISVTGKSQIRIRRERREDATVVPLEFVQDAHGPLSLAWGTESQRREARAPSLWHLCFEEPEVCSQHLLPNLEMLRPNWDLAKTAEQIGLELCQNAGLQQPLPRQRWTSLVVQLGNERYSKRQAADRELRDAGQAIRAFLEGFDRNALDAEQRHRMRRILATLSRRGDNDTPDGVATWLAGDPRIWFGLLRNGDPARRRLAAEQLGRLLEEPIDFDADAAPAVRQQQIDQLRPRIEKSSFSRPPEPAER